MNYEEMIVERDNIKNLQRSSEYSWEASIRDEHWINLSMQYDQRDIVLYMSRPSLNVPKSILKQLRDELIRLFPLETDKST